MRATGKRMLVLEAIGNGFYDSKGHAIDRLYEEMPPGLFFDHYAFTAWLKDQHEMGLVDIDYDPTRMGEHAVRLGTAGQTMLAEQEEAE